MDTLSNELKDLGSTSTIGLAENVYRCGATSSASTAPRSSIRGISVGSQFRASLQNLVADLERTEPHYIRCVKPNLHKTPSNMDAGEVLRQLRYSGMMEAIRIRREGYAVREDHANFYNRFSVLLQPKDLEKGGSGIEHLVRILSQRLNVGEADWQIGHSKIFLRRELADKLDRLARLRVHTAGRTVTRFGRQVAENRAGKLLVALFRLKLHLLHKLRQRKSATKLAAHYRRYVQRRRYSIIIDQIIIIQTLQRRISAHAKIRKIKDPYGDFTFAQVQKLLQNEQARLEGFVKDKMYTAAAKLEPKIEILKAEVEKKRPMTRALLEEQITDVQAKLDEAVDHKDYQECGPLQERLEKLTAKRKELPNLEELEQAIVNAESRVAQAIQSKDYTAAAEGQEQVAQAKKRLEETLTAARDEEDEKETSDEVMRPNNIHGVESRVQLEKEISRIQKEIKIAINKKEFNEASSLQKKMNELETLRPVFLTLHELETELVKVHTQQEDAIACKDFALAGQLNNEVIELEEKVQAFSQLEDDKIDDEIDVPKDENGFISIQSPDGDDLMFESRTDLENAVHNYKHKVTEHAESREFIKAEETQAFVDQLEKLKPRLPHLVELETTLCQIQREMDQAIVSKQFAKAESLNKKVSYLEKKVEIERKKQPKLPIVTPMKVRNSIIVKAPVLRTAPVVIDSRANVTVSAPRKLPHGTSSVKSLPSQVTMIGTDSTGPVSRLRPLRPVLANPNDNIVQVCKNLASKRIRAVIISNSMGGVAGILTDGDVTRRLVAKRLNPNHVPLAQIMTPNPNYVAITDSASDALCMMIENRFRHLPVVDKKGKICGLLDIGKCLNDAISKLERREEKSKSTNCDAAAVLRTASFQGGGAAQTAALKALLGPLVSQAIGKNMLPTLRSILAHRPGTLIAPSDTIYQASKKMAEHKKAALVVQNDRLVGILSFKDIMSRVIAKELPPQTTPVSDVMTPSPDSMDPNSSVLEALQLIHDQGFFSLPVCEANGQVVGLVDVMDVIYGCGGVDEWRSIFDSTIVGDDESILSEVSVEQSMYPHSIQGHSATSQQKKEKPVSKLRPRKPLLSSDDDSILSVSQMLANKRCDLCSWVKRPP